MDKTNRAAETAGTETAVAPTAPEQEHHWAPLLLLPLGFIVCSSVCWALLLLPSTITFLLGGLLNSFIHSFIRTRARYQCSLFFWCSLPHLFLHDLFCSVLFLVAIVWQNDRYVAGLAVVVVVVMGRQAGHWEIVLSLLVAPVDRQHALALVPRTTCQRQTLLVVCSDGNGAGAPSSSSASTSTTCVLCLATTLPLFVFHSWTSVLHTVHRAKRPALHTTDSSLLSSVYRSLQLPASLHR